MNIFAYIVSALFALGFVAFAGGFFLGALITLITFAKTTVELKLLRERAEALEEEASELVVRANKIIYNNALRSVVCAQQADETDYTKN